MKQQQRLMATMRRATAVLCAALLAPALAHAQTDHWPTKPLHLVVGYAAGSSPDVQARLLAEPLSQLLGQPVVVENKGGASGCRQGQRRAYHRRDWQWPADQFQISVSTPAL